MTLRSLFRFLPDGRATGRDADWLRIALRRLTCLVLVAMLLPLGGCIIPVEGEVQNATAADSIGRIVQPSETIVVAASVDEHDNDESIDCVRDRLGNVLSGMVVTDATAYRAVMVGSPARAKEVWVERLTALASDDSARARLATEHVRLVIELSSSHSNRWMPDHPTTPITSTESESTSFEAYIVDIDVGTVTGPVSVTVAGEGFTMISPLILSGWTPVTEGPACRHMADMLASTITGRSLAEVNPELAAMAERGAAEARIEDAKRVQTLASTQESFFDWWSLTCRAATSDKAQSVDGVNALWIGGTYRSGNAPGGRDPVSAMAWFTIASRNDLSAGPGVGLRNRFSTLAVDEMEKLETELNAEELGAAHVLVDGWETQSPSCAIDEADASLERLEHWNYANEEFEFWWRRSVIHDVKSGTSDFLKICRDAMHNDPRGLFTFANRYQHGYSPFHVDLIEAFRWYILAHDAGHVTADRFLDELRIRISPAQITEAEQRAAEWWPDPSQCTGMLDGAGAS